MMILKTRKFYFCFLFTLISLVSFSGQLSAQDAAADGKKIFETYCTACHKMGEMLIGPDLTGVKGRWDSEKNLHAFVKNSQEVIASGHPYAKKLFDKFNVVMPPQNLTEAEIKAVIDYADAGSQTAGGGGAAATGTGGGGGTVTAVSDGGFLGMSNSVAVMLLLLVFILLLVVAFVLAKARTQIARIHWEKEHPGETYPETGAGRWVGAIERKWKIYKEVINPYFVVMAIIGILLVVLLVDWYNRAQDLGNQIGYAPEQPVKFNHKIHAGQYGIQCQYCHTGVEKSKHANIPSTNICMNCHNYVKEGPQYGKDEIAKVTTAHQNNKPIEWVRIHNLPDHVYFNHQQHVVAGKVSCESCHGKVQEMERVQQVSTLEMGWCINCHRESKIDTENPYYTATFDFVKKHKKYTVAQMGGLECAKCHY